MDRSPDAGRPVFAATVLAACLLAVGPARAGAGDLAGRVLSPAAAESLGAALRDPSPDWALASVRAGATDAEARFCRTGDPAACATVRVADPDAGCPGIPAGALCVLPGTEVPPPALLQTVATRLGTVPAARLWIDPDARGRVVPASAAGPEPEPPGCPVGVALALVLAPLAAGLAAGLALARARRRRLAWPGWWVVLPVMAAGAGLLVPYRWLSLGTWDHLVASLSAALGFLLGGHRLAVPPDRRTAVLGAGAWVLALLALEGAARLLLAAPPSFPPPSELQWRLPPRDTRALDLAGLRPALFPDTEPAWLEGRLAVAGTGRPRVLHLGDSMVVGSFVRPEEAFPALLRGLEPGVAHVNGGLGGTSLDFQYLSLHAWLPRASFDRVVLYPFPGNDLEEMDQPYALCRGGPVLEDRDDRLAPRCDRPDFGAPEAPDRLRDPPPYALRVATAVSFAARHAVAAWTRLRGEPAARPPLARRMARVRQLLAALRDDLAGRGIPFEVVLMPVRWEVLGSEEGRRSAEVTAFLAGTLADLSIPWRDGAVPFREEARRSDATRLFVDDPPGDPHLSAEGHRLLAGWLHGQWQGAR